MFPELLPFLVMIIVYGGLFCLLINFIVKRLEDKKKENFEKRDN